MKQLYEINHHSTIDLSQVTAIEKPDGSHGAGKGLVVHLKGTEMAIFDNKFKAYQDLLDAWTQYVNHQSSNQ